jgi:hypothetical protein
MQLTLLFGTCVDRGDIREHHGHLPEGYRRGKGSPSRGDQT